MTEDVNRILFEAAEKVFEKLAFMFSFPAEDPLPSEDGDQTRVAAVSFEGPITGSLLLFLSESLLGEVAGNMLGIDESETTPDQHYDAFKELINVICGNFLPGVAGEQDIFTVGTPRVLEPENARAMMAQQAPFATASLMFDNGRGDLFLFTDSKGEDGFSRLRGQQMS